MRRPHLAQRLGASRLLERRIGIVGAGASGIALAYYLTRLGFERVTVLERSDRIGGKCYTICHEGRTFELGAGAITPRYRHTRELMKRAGVAASPRWSAAYLDPERGSMTRVPPTVERIGWTRAALEVRRILREVRRYPGLFDAGLTRLPRELLRPAAAYLHDAGFDLAGELVQPLFTGFGYGFYEDTPAAYLMRYGTIAGVPCELFDDGMSSIWHALARSLDVRLGVGIDRVDRGRDRVRVHSRLHTWDFDALVVTCPLDAALDFLDATPAEADLFSRIRYKPYYAVAAVAHGLPRARWMFVPDNFVPRRIGHPMFVYRRWKDRDLVVFFGHFEHGADSVIGGVHELVSRMGGRVDRVHTVQAWQYCPHVSVEDLDEGFYARIEALQGRRSTWYAGETLAYGVVEHCVGYAKALAEECFAPPR